MSSKILFKYEITQPYPNNSSHRRFKIFAQDSRIPSAASAPLFTATNGFQIKKSSMPEIRVMSKIIYIKGNSGEDCCYFKATDEEVKEIIEALEEFKDSFSFAPKKGKPHRLTKIFA